MHHALYTDPGCAEERTFSSCLAHRTRPLAWATSHERCAWRDCAAQCVFKQPRLFNTERAKTIAVLLAMLHSLQLLLNALFAREFLSSSSGLKFTDALARQSLAPTSESKFFDDVDVAHSDLHQVASPNLGDGVDGDEGISSDGDLGGGVVHCVKTGSVVVHDDLSGFGDADDDGFAYLDGDSVDFENPSGVVGLDVDVDDLHHVVDLDDASVDLGLDDVFYLYTVGHSGGTDDGAAVEPSNLDRVATKVNPDATTLAKMRLPNLTGKASPNLTEKASPDIVAPRSPHARWSAALRWCLVALALAVSASACLLVVASESSVRTVRAMLCDTVLIIGTELVIMLPVLIGHARARRP